jgi:tripartite-type tricarboxylate transporter receptor subunit TctC
MAGAKRSPAAPEVPTIAESGLPGYEISSWFGLVAPAATPPAVISRLHGDLARALQSAELRERLAPSGYEVISNTPDAFARHMRAQTERLGRVIREAGIKPE